MDAFANAIYDAFANAIYEAKATSILGLATIFLQQVATYLPEESKYKLDSLKKLQLVEKCLLLK